MVAALGANYGFASLIPHGVRELYIINSLIDMIIGVRNQFHILDAGLQLATYYGDLDAIRVGRMCQLANIALGAVLVSLVIYQVFMLLAFIVHGDDNDSGSGPIALYRPADSSKQASQMGRSVQLAIPSLSEQRCLPFKALAENKVRDHRAIAVLRTRGGPATAHQA